MDFVGYLKLPEGEAKLTETDPSAPHFLEISVQSSFHDLSQELTVTAGDTERTRPLVRGWNIISIPVLPSAATFRFSVNKLFPKAYYPEDTRNLSVRFRPAILHRDPERHRHVRDQQTNAVANTRELMAGATVLESTPQVLGIDMYGVCNVKPPCVYCAWDANKKLEGDHVHAPFTLETLAEWGQLFERASTLVNCSIGEPFMMKNFDELLDIFGDRGKALEITTNGQVLTDRNIRKLLGRDIHLYISLDAATAETYAKLRNNKWDRLIANLRRLIEAKRGRQGQPRIFAVFMPMRVNVHELDAFFELCADLEVDRVILRPLNFAEESDLNWERGGHVFNYLEQLLPMEELVRVSGRAAALAREHGLDLADQMDFGGGLKEAFPEEFAAGRMELRDKEKASGACETNGGETAQASETDPLPVLQDEPLPSLGEENYPPCKEPWTNLYILRRGILPCCYGGEPIAPMDGHQEIWNSPLLQEIRSELASHRFHDYCYDSPSCPIIRKAGLRPERGPLGSLHTRTRRVWTGLNRWTFGIPRMFYTPVKKAARKLRQSRRSDT